MSDLLTNDQWPRLWSFVLGLWSFLKRGSTMVETTILARAEEFIWSNARLLERRLFARLFKGAPAEPVLAALRAYQNEDGGFGNALEPDKRCPDSQPVDQEVALHVLDDVGMDEAIARRVCDFLMSI